MNGEAIFQRPAQSQIFGWIRYLIFVPILLIVFLPFVVVIGFVLVHVGVPQGAVVATGIVGGVGALFGLVRFAIADFRHSAGITVTIDSDALTINEAGDEVRVCFDDVVGMRLVPFRRDAQCVLYLADGSECRVPADPAPFSEMCLALDATLRPRLLARFGETLSAHDSIRVHDDAGRAALRLIRGLIAAPFFVLMGIRFGWGFITGTAWNLRSAWRGMKTDCRVSQDGIRVGNDPSLHEWSDLSEMHRDWAGLLLRFGDKTVAVSLFAENYWPFAAWLHEEFTSGDEADDV